MLGVGGSFPPRANGDKRAVRWLLVVYLFLECPVMFQFQLFGEWRNRTIYGETLEDAVTRVKELQRPDRSTGHIVPDARATPIPGEIVTVVRVICRRNTGNSTRGSNKYESVLIEDQDGKIHDVDAACKPV